MVCTAHSTAQVKHKRTRQFQGKREFDIQYRQWVVVPVTRDLRVISLLLFRPFHSIDASWDFFSFNSLSVANEVEVKEFYHRLRMGEYHIVPGRAMLLILFQFRTFIAYEKLHVIPSASVFESINLFVRVLCGWLCTSCPLKLNEYGERSSKVGKFSLQNRFHCELCSSISWPMFTMQCILAAQSISRRWNV